MDDLVISFVGSNGDTIEFTNDGDYVLTSGVRGFGIPATSVRIDESAGDGGTWRHTKRGVRNLDLPVVIFGLDRADVETKLRRLSRLLQTSKGATKIIATYTDAPALFLDAHYTGGAETQFGSDANGYFCRWVIQMQAPQPYWQAFTESHFDVSSGDTGRGILPNLSKLKVSSDSVIGVVAVDNVGDVTIQPRWVIRGPVSELLISNGTQSFGFTDIIGEGIIYTVDTATGRAYDNEGNNVYAKLSTAPKLFGLPPGESTVTVSGKDSSPNTQITCYYSERYEVVH